MISKQVKYSDKDFLPDAKEFADPIWHVYKTMRIDSDNEIFSRWDFIELRAPSAADADDQPEASTSTDEVVTNGENSKKRKLTTKKTKTAKVSKASKDAIIEDDAPWIGQIISIKAVAATNVCIEVKWMYASKAQLLDANVYNPPELIGTELVMGLDGTKYYDIQTSEMVSQHVDVMAFDERDPLQGTIDSDTYFYRKTLELQRVSVTRKKSKKTTTQTRIVVKPMQDPTCPCKKEYEPLPLQPESSMIFCPRNTCRNWYHLSCCRQTPGTEQGELELMSSRYASPETLEQVPIKASPSPSRPPLTISSEDRIPADVLRYACAHVARGDKLNGIVGNGAVVLSAREILAAEQTLRAEMIEEWRTRYKAENWVGVGTEMELVPIRGVDWEVEGNEELYLCPSCQHVI